MGLGLSGAKVQGCLSYYVHCCGFEGEPEIMGFWERGFKVV